MSVLHGFRRSQRRVARGVLALFGLVWLQLAVTPCGAVHATPADAHRHDAPAVHGPAHAGHGQAGHAGHASHGGGDPAGHHVPGPSSTDAAAGDASCPWCPPQDGADGCQDGSRCAFPHVPQVDARLPLLFLPAPEAPVYPVPSELAPCVLRTGEGRPEPVPRRSFTIGYCRFIE